MGDIQEVELAEIYALTIETAQRQRTLRVKMICATIVLSFVARIIVTVLKRDRRGA